jgi:hypothetical protein
MHYIYSLYEKKLTWSDTLIWSVGTWISWSYCCLSGVGTGVEDTGAFVGGIEVVGGLSTFGKYNNKVVVTEM